MGVMKAEKDLLKVVTNKLPILTSVISEDMKLSLVTLRTAVGNSKDLSALIPTKEKSAMKVLLTIGPGSISAIVEADGSWTVNISAT